MKFQSQRGVALVITLIMLSVITFLTVAFLAVSRRDRASVTTSLSQTDSHLMADTALARFQSELTARMMANNNLQSYDLMQTRNYINPAGFDPNPPNRTNFDNVNYDYYVNTLVSPLNNNDKLQNIANLFYDPRPPVFVKTNRDSALPLDFRFYLDYNRNQRFETNGTLPVVIDEAGNTSGTADFLGEPEWIGVLQNPEYPHSATNRFVGRYLYLALPISRTLDLNYIHNYSKGNVGSLPPQVSLANGDGFLRNQGYGSYELNLAAFLHDLNTNMYPDALTASYQYFPNAPSANGGSAFNDAVSFLSYRYMGNLFNLSNVANAFPGNGTTAFSGATAFGKDFVDGYSTRPILVSPFHNTTDPDATPANLTTRPWPGSKNPKQFFEPQELFDTNKISPGVFPNFVTRLQTVVSNNNSYDRYTFSRLLEQIGTGSEPELRGKININYVNDPAQNTVSTNFAEWTPYQFFTNVAERLIRDNRITNVVSGVTNIYLFNTNIANRVRPEFSVTNILIYSSNSIPSKEYTAPLHRLLQIAANVYDATTSNKFPTIYRPQFQGSLGSAYITNFAVETNFADHIAAAFPPKNEIQDRTNITNPDGLVWGVPFIVAAKKGFPSFNEFMLQTSVQVSRNLEITKPDTNSLPNATNQMLVIGISNFFGLEAWNSYLRPYTNRVQFIATNLLTMALTNEMGTVIWPADGKPTNFGVSAKMTVSFWPGASGSGAFILPFTNTAFNFITNLKFHSTSPSFVPITNIVRGVREIFEKGVGYTNPTWGIAITNRLIYALIDSSAPGGRVIDFVNLDGMTANIDIIKALQGDNLIQPPGFGDEPAIVRQLWNTNRIDGSANGMIPTEGMRNQMLISLGMKKTDESLWTQYGYKPPVFKADAINAFQMFYKRTPTEVGSAGTIPRYAVPAYTNTQTPFNPTRKFDQTISWQVNDPLVHYMSQDLLDSTNISALQVRIPPTGPPAIPNNLRHINERYRPWGRRFGSDEMRPGTAGTRDDGDFAYDLRVKDPRVRWSDDWDFPTNKFPSIGWLGRVHRGTPWQTIYLKAAAITNRVSVDDTRASKQIGSGLNWENWSGHMETHPTNDWKLMDVFTAAPNDNAARGLLSVNQTNQAAWAAALSGVVALTNWLNDAQAKNSETQIGQTNAFTSVVIQPGNAISNIVHDINEIRRTSFNGTFNSLGDILAVPSLSVSLNPNNGLIESSPFLNVTNYNLVGTNKIVEADAAGKPKNQDQRFYGVTDEAYERIPQQIMSLLKFGEPEYVVYCYGQSLKPAPNSIVVSAPIGSGLFNLCTNYQITGEVVTRTRLRVEGTPQNPKTVIESYNVLPAE